MRISRFFLLILIVFAISFLWAGGNTFSGKTIDKLQEVLPNSSNTSSKTASTAEEKITEESGTFDKFYRIISLKSAVNKAVTTKHYTPLNDISLDLQHAIIAVEDSRFYEHTGFDISSIMRASLVNLQYGHVEEGASTITQQLAKNLFLSHERSMSRKVEEFALALDLEMNYSKKEILELYLNTIYFGSGFYGIHDAAIGYFGVTPDKLSLAEATMLAGLPNAPSLYSPYEDFKAAKTRQAIVISRMRQMEYISEELAEETKKVKIWLAN